MAASARLDELRNKFEENPRRYFAPLANEYRKAGDLEQAIAICQEFLPQQPGHMSGHIVYGQALYEAQRHQEARAVFETALSLDPENLIALRHLGDISRALGDTAAARSWYQRVLEADPRNEEIAALLQGLVADTPEGEMAPEPESAAPQGLSFISDGDFAESEPEAPVYSEPGGAVADEDRAVHESLLDFGPPSGAETTETGFLDFVPETGGSDGSQPQETLELMPDFGSSDPEANAGLSVELNADFVPPAEAEATPAMDIGLEPTAFGAAAAQEFDVPPLDSVEMETSLDAGMPSIELDSMVPGAEPQAAAPGEDTVANAFPGMFDLAGPAPDAASGEPGLEGLAQFEIETQGMEAAGDESEQPAGPEPTTPGAMDLVFLEPDGDNEPDPAAAMPEPDADADPAATRAPRHSSPAAEQAFVTETMAELYLRQGHVQRAIDVYRQLLESRPGDRALLGKLEQAETLLATEAPAAESSENQPEPGPAPFSAAGPTIREFLAGIAAGGP